MYLESVVRTEGGVSLFSFVFFFISFFDILTPIHVKRDWFAGGKDTIYYSFKIDDKLIFLSNVNLSRGETSRSLYVRGLVILV